MNDYSLNIADNTQNSNVLKDKFKDIQKNGLPSGLNVGLKVVDDLFRLDTKKLVVLTGIPSAGKSEFIDFLCVQYNNTKLLSR
ncbi:hypothetical protein EZS27_038178 [termite gut metagenome]|uniref:SF4 helicase domain-containing protein n=1 Tax=termite gut metagenome TaxID=433724 RepID=A0A5J4PNS3_9ZZZZ